MEYLSLQFFEDSKMQSFKFEFFFASYFTRLGMVNYCDEKSVFFAYFFRNISKTAETILIKKNWAKPRHFGLQKRSNQ